MEVVEGKDMPENPKKATWSSNERETNSFDEAHGNPHPRYSTNLQVRYSADGESWGICIARLISVGGLTLECDIPIAVQTEVIIEIPLENPGESGSVKIIGKVTAGRTAAPPFQCQIVFNSMGDDDRALLIELIAQLLMSGKAHSTKE